MREFTPNNRAMSDMPPPKSMTRNVGNLGEFFAPIRVDTSSQNRVSGVKRPAHSSVISTSYERLNSGLSSSSPSGGNRYMHNVQRIASHQDAHPRDEEEEDFSFIAPKRSKISSHFEVR